MYDVTSMRDLGIGVNSVSGFQTWQIVSVVLAIVGGLFVYFTFYYSFIGCCYNMAI